MASTTPTTALTQEATPAAIVVLPHVTIRPYNLSDAPDSSRQANDPGIARNMRNAFPSPYSLEDAQSFISNVAVKPTSASDSAPLRPAGVLLHYAIVRSSDGAFIGGIGIKPFADVEARMVEIGYWLGKEHWGRGYATEATRGFSRWVFETFPDVQRLEARVFEANLGSVAVLLKAGFQKEGVRRKAIWKDGVAMDEVVFGLLREECLGYEGGKDHQGLSEVPA